MPHLQYLKLPLQFKSKITEHLYTKRELVVGMLVDTGEVWCSSGRCFYPCAV